MDYIKVSFLGDIMCEKPFLKAARKKAQKYDFDKAFENLKILFEKSDYVVGNLETVCAGEMQGYTKELYSFNTPDSFINSLKKCGVNFVSTANNHCLDRGIAGLKRTLDVLDSQGIEHTGTYRTRKEAEQNCIVDIRGLRLGILSYTYGTNSNINGVMLSDDEIYCVDLLQPQETQKDMTNLLDRVKGLIPIETKTKVKKMLGKSYKNVTVDKMPDNFNMRYFDKLKNDIKQIKELSDYTVCLLHCGGQFNLEPGPYSEYVMEFLQREGIDSIIGNHPHNIQKAKRIDNGIKTYCLGNVSISPSSIYVPMEHHPDYSAMVHLYFGKTDMLLKKITVSLLKIVESDDKYLEVMPVFHLYQNAQESIKKELVQSSREVLQVFMGQSIEAFKMQEEWDVL